jgi:5-histidylcysteine sulfoxide synthase/putative 4-mercaptohistidine N1-methyltranferase
MNNLTQAKTPWLTGTSVEEKRAEIKHYFHNTWQTYESLFALINNDNAYYLRPEPLRHPLIFYFGHTATFYINKLILGKYIKHRINHTLEAICAVGVDEMSWDDLDSRHYSWPSVAEVKTYRSQVYDLVNQLIDSMDFSLPISQNSLAWVILMGCEHERIHLETSSVIMRMLELKHLTANAQWQPCPYSGNAPTNELMPIKGKLITLGKKDDDLTYGWDNEYGELTLDVDDFQVTKYLVSNQEYLTFVEAGGYQNQDYWTKEGQQWLAYTKALMPCFWRKQNDKYLQRNLTEEIPLPLNWPVEINYLEAKAFCQWKALTTKQNVRLPTEAEWMTLRDTIKEDLPTWQEAPGNTNLEYFASSCPVDKFEHQGIYDIIGNVWQWTESTIDGFNHFNVHPLYDDFSTPTFDGKHNLIKGGSWISTGNEAIKSSRYAFRRHFYQHAGFRYVISKTKEAPVTEINPYETSTEICQKIAQEYNPKTQYIAELVSLINTATIKNNTSKNKLLNLGCGVGRVAFELAPYFEYIDAIDFSAQTIQHAVKLQQQETVRYTTINEGDIVDFHHLSLHELNLSGRGNNILFSQGDASNLKQKFTGYNIVIMDQVLEKSYQPKQVLTNIIERLLPQGLLVIASSYCFDESITTKENWLGGIKVNGENVTGFDGLHNQLTEHFTLINQQPLTTINTLNSHQTISTLIDVTVWKKN